MGTSYKKKMFQSATMIKKFTSLFPLDFKSVFVSLLTGKILSFKFYPRLFSLSTRSGFHGPPFFTFKTDRLGRVVQSPIKGGET